MKTVAQQVVKSRLLRTSAPSRETGAKRPPSFRPPARKAKSAKDPPIKITRIRRMKTPRVGSLAKAWTEVNTPERTRKVPTSDREKARIERKIVQILRASRFSITAVQCSSAVAASHGISDAFSTGSQNQKPPQPSV